MRLLLARRVNVFHLFVCPVCFIKPAAAIGPGDGGGYGSSTTLITHTIVRASRDGVTARNAVNVANSRRYKYRPFASGIYGFSAFPLLVPSSSIRKLFIFIRTGRTHLHDRGNDRFGGHDCVCVCVCDNNDDTNNNGDFRYKNTVIVIVIPVRAELTCRVVFTSKYFPAISHFRTLCSSKM